MSRIGKQPIEIPEGVKVEINGSEVKVIGPKGELEQVVRPEVKIEIQDNQVLVAFASCDTFAILFFFHWKA